MIKDGTKLQAFITYFNIYYFANLIFLNSLNIFIKKPKMKDLFSNIRNLAIIELKTFQQDRSALYIKTNLVIYFLNKKRSASIAAMQPYPAAVIAC